MKSVDAVTSWTAWDYAVLAAAASEAWEMLAWNCPPSARSEAERRMTRFTELKIALMKGRRK